MSGFSTLSKLLKQGTFKDELPFEAVFKEFYSRLVHFSFKLIGDKDRSEDIVQDAFITYFNQKSSIANHKLAIKNFLYSTVKHACINAVRHDKVVERYSLQVDLNEVEEATVIRSLVQSEVIAEIYRAMETLPESCRIISQMGFLEGLKNSEIAQKLGISVNTVKTQKQRALQMLRLRLNPEIFGFFLLFISE